MIKTCINLFLVNLKHLNGRSEINEIVAHESYVEIHIQQIFDDTTSALLMAVSINR